MLTFENVLDAFADYLKEDQDLEVVLTRHGYTLLIWDNEQKNWETSESCATPEILLEHLENAYKIFSFVELTKGSRELLPADQEKILAECAALRERCFAPTE